MTLYDILGINKNATAQEVKRAYRKKAKENHEDVGGNVEEMIKINKAWMVLRDSVKRNRYDKTGEEDSDSFEVKFGVYVQQIFMNIVEQNDVDYTDLISEFMAYNELMINDNKKKVVECAKRQKKLEKAINRLEGDRIRVVLERNVEQVKLEAGVIEEHIKFLEECSECLASCYYRFDEKPAKREITWSINDLRR